VAEHIEAKIDQNETKLQYKNHVLWLRSIERKSGGWTPRTVVVLPEVEGNGEHELEEQTMFAEREEADKHALLMGKQWIDQKEADILTDQEIERP
jgi:hypothetical protein